MTVSYYKLPAFNYFLLDNEEDQSPLNQLDNNPSLGAVEMNSVTGKKEDFKETIQNFPQDEDKEIVLPPNVESKLSLLI